MSAKRILVVDDDPAIASLTGNWLRRAGFNVVVAVGVEEASTLAPREFDLVVSDVRMPGGGVDAIRALWPDVPFVTISGAMTGADVLKGEHFYAELLGVVRSRLAPPPPPSNLSALPREPEP